jgi:hypothetical protein
MMNCYAGLAKRLAKTCFQEVKPSQVIHVPQLEPLDARNIIKREVKDISTNKECFALSDAYERSFKPTPISDEEGWEVRRSRRNGRVWYFHAATKKKTWTRPMTETKVPSEEDKFDAILAQLVALRARVTELEFVDAYARVKAAKEARRAWNVANDPSTWYRV